jgi:acetolactate synthase I/II/III large subunit
VSAPGIRVADLVAQIVRAAGIRQVFMVTGGGAMHLNDALTRAEGLDVLFMHHEQACAMAAEGYARLCGVPALVNVTTGPGGINALNGVFGAYTDSVPMLVISGQVKRETVAALRPLPEPLSLRQLGDQEADVLAMARPVTKFAAMLDDPADAAWLVERAIWIARSGRPGPVWIDVPIDVQAARVDPARLRRFVPAEEPPHPNEAGALAGEALRARAREVLALLARAERPVILPGTGVRTAGAVDAFRALVDRLGAPVATAFNAHDLVPDDHPLFVGKPGTVGDRAGNFAVQNADLVLVLGCRLNIRQISYNWAAFARAATKVMVDIDRAELEKHTLAIDLPVHAELKGFLDAMLAEAGDAAPPPSHGRYLAWCKARLARYPANLPDYAARPSPVNPYAFAGLLWEELGADDAVVTANATACIVTFQTARLKEGQRLFSNSGSASMGYDLPAAIGAHLAGVRLGNLSGRTVCIAGDGSLMMNLQELQTLAGNRLPIKVFLLNNAGYSSILQSQEAWFPDNVAGCGPRSGVGFPDFLAVAAAFGIPGRRIAHLDEARAAIRATLDADGPALCEVMLDPAATFAPKLSSRRLEDGRMVSAALEDMAPFLPREEFAENMLIPPAED